MKKLLFVIISFLLSATVYGAWVSGNSFSLKIEATSDDTGDTCQIISYDSSAALAPFVIVNWSDGVDTVWVTTIGGDRYWDQLGEAIDSTGKRIKHGDYGLAARYYHGMYWFDGLAVDCGEVLTSAYFKGIVKTRVDETSVTFKVEASDDAAAFGNFTNTTTRTYGDSTVATTIGSGLSAGDTVSVDITKCIQQLVMRGYPAYDTVTICESGCDYATLLAAEDTEDSATDLTVSNKCLIYHITGSWTAVEDAEVEFNGITTDATRYIKIVATGNATHSGGAYRSTGYNLANSAGIGLDVYTDYTVIEGLQFVGNTADYGIIVRSGADHVRVDKCIFSDVDDNGIWAQDGSTNFTASNCLAYKNTTGGFTTNNATNDTARFFNCTAISNNVGFGMGANGGVCLWQNCLSLNNGTLGAGDFNGAGLPDYCASGGTDLNNYSGRTGNRVSQLFSFADSANGDYTLLASDTAALDYGTDLSSYFTDDIEGDSRSGSWDIGYDEYITQSVNTVISRRRKLLTQ